MPADPPSLSLLLNLSSLHSSALVSQRFTEIAEALLHNYYLRIEHEGAATDFELLEVEFYFQKSGVHEDPFCHAHLDQEKPGQWYFHRAPRRVMPHAEDAVTSVSSQGYRGGTRKGLDLTFGAPIASSFFSQKSPVACRGGVLLRAMRLRGETTDIIPGPSLLVDKILSITGSRDITDLISTKLEGNLSALPQSGVVLSPTQKSNQTRMYFNRRASGVHGPLPSVHRSPRIGLDLSHPSATAQSHNPRVVYLAKLYRYFIHPELPRLKGRCQTFIGLCLESSLDASTGFDKAELVQRLAESMAINRKAAEGYIDDYNEGFNNGSLVKYIGVSGKGVYSKPRTLLRLMGVLGRMGVLTGVDQG